MSLPFRRESEETDRLLALSDGVIAIAITLLVLEITVPELPPDAPPSVVQERVLEQWDEYFGYVLSFLVIGLYWTLHRRVFVHVERHDRGVLWLNLLFLLFVAFVPYGTSVFSISGADGLLPLGLLAFGVLGFLFVLVALPVALVVIAWVLVSAVAAETDAYVTEQRLRVLDWAETVEETRWWGPFVNPTERLAFVDPLSDEERFEAALARTRSAYVAGDLSEAEFERCLDRLFGIEPDGFASYGYERPSSAQSAELADKQTFPVVSQVTRPFRPR